MLFILYTDELCLRKKFFDSALNPYQPHNVGYPTWQYYKQRMCSMIYVKTQRYANTICNYLYKCNDCKQ